MGRFLIFFSYFGTRYSGVQQQTGAVLRGKPVRTVAGALETALKCLGPSNDIKLCLSSRTDSGVHALKNSCHVNLVHPETGKEYNPIVVTNVVNTHLEKQGEDIRVLQTRQVPEIFSSRFNAVSRKYVYRLGHMVKPDESLEVLDELKVFASRKGKRLPILPLGQQLSALDSQKAMILRRPIDISKLISAAEMLSGIHNFWSFTSKRKSQQNPPHPMKMLTIGVKRGQPFGHQLQRCGLDVTENIEFWDIHVQSKSFMYRQIRRLVGAMVLVARDVISLSDLRDILDNPQKEFPFSHSMCVHEDGLFLVDIDYRPKDLEIGETTKTGVVSDELNTAGPSAAHEADVESASDSSDEDRNARRPSLKSADDGSAEEEDDEFSLRQRCTTLTSSAELSTKQQESTEYQRTVLDQR